MSYLAIKSSKTILHDGEKNVVVIIKDGVIIDITNDFPEDENCRKLDVKNKVLMAGVIDPHVHINEPGRTDWEGFDTATKAAIAGGITTLVDMPLNSSPVTTTAAAFDKKINATKNQMHTNCGFWGGVIPDNANDIEPLIEKGVLGFKAFLTHSGIDEFPNVTESELRKVMPMIAKYDLPLLVHCELNYEVMGRESKANISYSDYLASRPKKWEDDAIALMIRLCEEFNCKIHIVHLSSANSIEQIAKAKQKGLPLTVETGQHYLYFNAEQIEDAGVAAGQSKTQFKCAPPIREIKNNETLWNALKDGIIDLVATDHSPSPPALKESLDKNFDTTWGGIASLQFALPALWTAAKKRNCTLNDLAKWLCENPSKLIGKQNSKGKIQKGYDADLVIWDSENTFTVSEKMILHKHKITPYMHEQLTGIVEKTFLAGQKIFDNGNIKELNKGKLLLR